MQGKHARKDKVLEGVVAMTYRNWRTGHRKSQRIHPDEESIACLVEGRLPEREQRGVLAHVTTCLRCRQALDVYFKADQSLSLEVPQELLARLKSALEEEARALLLEVALRVRDNIIEVLNAGGDILVGQELMPAPVLRSRKITEFKDEIFIFRDFKDIRVEAKIENKQGGHFGLCVTVKDKKSQQTLKDVRVALLKGDTELESYVCEKGAAVFENVELGSYRVEICGKGEQLAAIALDIKT